MVIIIKTQNKYRGKYGRNYFILPSDHPVAGCSCVYVCVCVCQHGRYILHFNVIIIMFWRRLYATATAAPSIGIELVDIINGKMYDAAELY